MHKSGVIEYQHDGYACEGFAVWDDAGAKRPGILVFPEWVGVGEYTHKRAQMLGDLGFNAFVVDVYGKGIRPNTPETCQAEMMKYATNRPLLRERARCGLDQLRKMPNTDLSKMAAIGYCFGGLAVLEMARDGQNNLAGVVSFHGVLATPTPLKPESYKGKILVLHGVEDPVVPDDQTMAFWKEMRDCQGKLGVRRLRQRAPHLHQLADARGRAAMLRQAGCIAMSGQIVDASLVAAPRQRIAAVEHTDAAAYEGRRLRDTDDEKKAIKQGRIPPNSEIGRRYRPTPRSRQGFIRRWAACARSPSHDRFASKWATDCV